MGAKGQLQLRCVLQWHMLKFLAWCLKLSKWVTTLIIVQGNDPNARQPRSPLAFQSSEAFTPASSPEGCDKPCNFLPSTAEELSLRDHPIALQLVRGASWRNRTGATILSPDLSASQCLGYGYRCPRVGTLCVNPATCPHSGWLPRARTKVHTSGIAHCQPGTATNPSPRPPTLG